MELPELVNQMDEQSPHFVNFSQAELRGMICFIAGYLHERGLWFSFSEAIEAAIDATTDGVEAT